MIKESSELIFLQYQRCNMNIFLLQYQYLSKEVESLKKTKEYFINNLDYSYWVKMSFTRKNFN